MSRVTRDHDFRAWGIVRQVAETDPPTGRCGFCGLLMRNEAWWQETWSIGVSGKRVLQRNHVVFVEGRGHEDRCAWARARKLIAEVDGP